MFEPQIISIGPVFLPITLIVLVILIFGAAWLTERWSPERKDVRGTVSEWLSTALLIALLVYKFGPALLNLKQVFRQPATLLYSSGTDLSTALAIILAVGWLGWKLTKSSYPWEAADVIAVASLLTVVSYNVLFKDYGATMTGWWGWEGSDYRYHPLNLYRLIVLLPLLGWVLARWRKIDSGGLFAPITVSIGAAYTLSSFAAYQTSPLLFGLTLMQWAGILVALAGFTFLVVRDWKKRARQNE